MWKIALSRLFGRRDPYDLRRLGEVHREKAWQPGDPEPIVGTYAVVMCPKCASEYDSRLGACPRCGTGGFHF